MAPKMQLTANFSKCSFMALCFPLIKIKNHNEITDVIIGNTVKSSNQALPEASSFIDITKGAYQYTEENFICK